MMKIGFLSMPLTGHLNPMTTLARKLQSRGHEVVFFGVPDAERIVRAAKLDFVVFGEEEYPVGSTAKNYAPLAKLHGEEVVRHSAQELHPRRCKITLEQLPAKLVEEGVEGLVVDTVYFFGELAAMSVGIPYVHIWNILHVDPSGTTPASFFSWPHETTPEAFLRNVEGLKRVGSYMEPLKAVAMAFAREKGLQIDWAKPAPTASKLAAITQTPKEFDFAGAPWPPTFHYAGPFHDEGGREEVPFPWEKLTGERLIYASLGTLVNGMGQLFRTILEAVKSVPNTQLVLSVGNIVSADDLGPIPANAIVVSKAPQIELLKRAALCITHAGMNTALESLAQGVPMVAIPIAFDQPGVAARIAHHGVGEVIQVEDLTAERLAGAIQKVLNDPNYRAKARSFQDVIVKARGLDVAADVVEQAFQKSATDHSVKEGAGVLHV